MSINDPSARIGRDANDPGMIKAPKVQSCVLCQQRKTKCNRGSPCSNCQKAGVECVSASTLNRPRKKRFAEAELLARLRRYEDLLRNYGADIDELRHNDPIVDSKSEPRRSGADASGRLLKSPKLEDLSIVDKEGNSQHESDEWRDAKEDFVATEEMLRGAPEDGIGEAPITTTFDTSFSDRAGGALLGLQEADIDITKLHPTPLVLFRLWQTFLDRVYPVYKVFHAPTIQQQIFEAASDLQHIPKGFEALLFSIYCCAVKSLSSVDCKGTFGDDKSTLLARFQLGAQQALGNAGFLRTSDLTVLQALVLYLPTLNFNVDPRALSCLVGVAVRIAQRMGLQRDPKGVFPFEAEIRRRLWWHIVLVDDRIAEFSGAGASILLHRWSTRLPLNINDGELYPGMREPPVEHSGPTEMIFFLSRCEIADLLRKIRSQPSYGDNWFELSTSAVSLETKNKAINDLEESLERKYLRFCERTVPIQYLTEIMARSTICKLRLIVHHPRLLPDRGASMSRIEKDTVFSWGVKMLDYHHTIQTNPLFDGYFWFTNMNAPMLGYIYVLNELRIRTTGKLADEGWRQVVMSISTRRLKFHWENVPVIKESAINMALNNMVVKAWDARQAACPSLPVPEFVTDLRRQLPKKKPKIAEASEQRAAPVPAAEPDPANETHQFYESDITPIYSYVSPTSWMPTDDMMDLEFWNEMMNDSEMPLRYVTDQQGYQ